MQSYSGCMTVNHFNIALRSNDGYTQRHCFFNVLFLLLYSVFFYLVYIVHLPALLAL